MKKVKRIQFKLELETVGSYGFNTTEAIYPYVGKDEKPADPSKPEKPAYAQVKLAKKDASGRTRTSNRAIKAALYDDLIQYVPQSNKDVTDIGSISQKIGDPRLVCLGDLFMSGPKKKASFKMTPAVDETPHEFYKTRTLTINGIVQDRATQQSGQLLEGAIDSLSRRMEVQDQSSINYVESGFAPRKQVSKCDIDTRELQFLFKSEVSLKKSPDKEVFEGLVESYKDHFARSPEMGLNADDIQVGTVSSTTGLSKNQAVAMFSNKAMCFMVLGILKRCLYLNSVRNHGGSIETNKDHFLSQDVYIDNEGNSIPMKDLMDLLSKNEIEFVSGWNFNKQGK